MKTLNKQAIDLLKEENKPWFWIASPCKDYSETGPYGEWKWKDAELFGVICYPRIKPDGKSFWDEDAYTYVNDRDRLFIYESDDKNIVGIGSVIAANCAGFILVSYDYKLEKPVEYKELQIIAGNDDYLQGPPYPRFSTVKTDTIQNLLQAMEDSIKE